MVTLTIIVQIAVSELYCNLNSKGLYHLNVPEYIHYKVRSKRKPPEEIKRSSAKWEIFSVCEAATHAPCFIIGDFFFLPMFYSWKVLFWALSVCLSVCLMAIPHAVFFNTFHWPWHHIISFQASHWSTPPPQPRSLAGWWLYRIWSKSYSREASIGWCIGQQVPGEQEDGRLQWNYGPMMELGQGQTMD